MIANVAKNLPKISQPVVTNDEKTQKKPLLVSAGPPLYKKNKDVKIWINHRGKAHDLSNITSCSMKHTYIP